MDYTTDLDDRWKGRAKTNMNRCQDGRTSKGDQLMK